MNQPPLYHSPDLVVGKFFIIIRFVRLYDLNRCRLFNNSTISYKQTSILDTSNKIVVSYQCNITLATVTYLKMVLMDICVRWSPTRKRFHEGKKMNGPVEIK